MPGAKKVIPHPIGRHYYVASDFTRRTARKLHPPMKKILMALVAATTLLSVSVSAKTEKQIRDENKAKAYKEKKAAEKAERKAKQEQKKAAKKK